MDEDIYPTPQNSPADEPVESEDADAVLASPRVFDISPDLNISPIEDAPSEPAQTPPPNPAPIRPAPAASSAAQTDMQKQAITQQAPKAPAPATPQTRYGIRAGEAMPAKKERIDLSGDALKARIAAINATAPNWKPALKVPAAPQTPPKPAMPPPVAPSQAPVPEQQAGRSGLIAAALLRVMPTSAAKMQRPQPPQYIPANAPKPMDAPIMPTWNVTAFPPQASAPNIIPAKPVEAVPEPRKRINLMEDAAPQEGPKAPIPAPVASAVPVPQPAMPLTPLQDFSNALFKTQIPVPGAPTSPQSPAVREERNPLPPMPASQVPERPRPAAPGLEPDVINPPSIPLQNTARQKVLRTYESDVAEVMSHQRSSIASIAIAESKKNEGQESIGAPQAPQKASSGAGKKALLVLASIALVGGGIAGAYYLYSMSPLAPGTAPIVAQPQTPSGLVPADAQVALPVDNRTTDTILAEIRSEVAKPQAPGTIKEIVLTQNENGQQSRITGPEIVSLMDIPAPDVLVRSLTDPWMLGVYADAQGNKSVFVIATTDFFQNAFAGMLQWENVMADDLKQYIYPTSISGIADVPASSAANEVTASNPLVNLNSILPQSASSTASTTLAASSSRPTAGTSGSVSENQKSAAPAASKTQAPLPSDTIVAASATNTDQTGGQASGSIQPLFTLQGQFQDRIIKNKDVREFVTSGGSVLFLYSFIDTTHLVVSGSEAALAEIVTRLENQAFVR